MSWEAEFRYCPDAFPPLPPTPTGSGEPKPMPPWKRRDWDRYRPEWEARQKAVHQEVLKRARGLSFATAGVELLQYLIAEAVEDLMESRVSSEAHAAYRDARGHTDGPPHYHWTAEFGELLNRYRKILGSRTEGVYRVKTDAYFWRSDADAARNPE